MPRGKFAQIHWEERPRLETLGAEAAPSPLTALLERTKLPRHPQGDAATVREETEFLLQCAAEVEHQFIVQYLYAAFSLDLTDETPEVRQWFNHLRQIAKEEMGHLLTVQNLLLCIGAQPYLERQTSPPPEPLPFPLTLEPFGLPFVSRFLVAESPADPEALPEELRNLKETIDHVGVLYAMLYWLFQASDERVCPWLLPADFDFPPGRHLTEADYADPAVLGDRINRPSDWTASDSIHVLPDPSQTPLTTRQQIADAARGAIFDVAAQGEGPNDPQDDPGPCPPLPPATASHYERLLQIFNQLKAAGGTAPVRHVPTDPQVSQITDPVANRLARGMDLRYNLLMLEIAIAVFTRRSTTVSGQSVIETVPFWALSDMTQSIREMSLKLMTLPRTQGGTVADGAAAPPFTIPADPFPADERGRWQRLIEILDAYAAVLGEPTAGSDPDVDAILDAAGSDDTTRRQFATDALAQLFP
ncbi:MAG TPA: ferritin-like domain-containing protein [Thermoanaerobaculia bacterium]|nr:ferritin-like domain-containing protein [Thermoanaerobaculia bacterium]